MCVERSLGTKLIFLLVVEFLCQSPHRMDED